MAEVEFLPVLLGSDANVYGMARSFHEEYGLRSLAVSKTVCAATVNTKLIDFTFEPDLENPEKFLARLLELKDRYPGKKLLLIPCGDGYVKLVVKFQKELAPYYSFNCLSEELLEKLSLKESFYEICDKYGFDYPKTEVVSREDWQSKQLPFHFPVILKASNSVEYWKCSFPGKRKVFEAKDPAEYERILKAVYSSSYQDHMTVQELIPGDDSYMRVLNCYVGTDKKVKLMALGQPLLEEYTPQGLGNYMAIVNTFDGELLERFRVFLEDIGYQGFANFDMKLDPRDGRYKLFETNVRQGRSSFFVTASGYNLAKWLVDDVIYQKVMPLTIAQTEHLWIQIPRGVLYKYLPHEELKQKARRLIREGKCTNSLLYKPDNSPWRYLKIKLVMLNHYRKYRRYFGKRGMPAS